MYKATYHVRWLLTDKNALEYDEDDDDGDVKFVGMIVGSIIGGLLCLSVIIVFIIFCLCR